MRGILARLLVCAASLTLAATAVHTQAPPRVPRMTGSAIVFGTIVADDTGRPIAGASVTAIVQASAATFSKSTTTDRLGRFVLTGLAAGRVRVSASSPGYLGGVVGQSGPDDTIGTFISMVDGQIADPISLRLRHGASISGILTDEAGEPLGGVTVQAFRRSLASGRQAFASAGNARTDDRGVYRVANLAAGTYLVGVVPRTMLADVAYFENVAQTGRGGGGGEAAAVLTGTLLRGRGDASAQPFMFESASGTVQIVPSGSAVAPPAADGTPRSYPATFFPGVSAPQASTLTIASGEDRIGINFSLAPLPAGRILGRVVSPSGDPPPLTAVTLTSSADDLSPIGDTMTALVGADGRLLLPDVPVGTYRLEARTGFGGQITAAEHQRLWASVNVTVGDSAVGELAIGLREGLTLSGSLRFDGRTPPPTDSARSAWAVSISAASPTPSSLSSSSAASVQVDATGHFTFPSGSRR